MPTINAKYLELDMSTIEQANLEQLQALDMLYESQKKNGKYPHINDMDEHFIIKRFIEKKTIQNP